MHVAVGITTFNPISNMRFDLLEETVDSVVTAFGAGSVVLLDNGSTDGSTAALRERSDVRVIVRGAAENTTPGAGRNVLYRHLRAMEPDICVFSDDDMRWLPGARERIESFWRGQPPYSVAAGSIMILGGLLEPVYPWNTPRARVESGGVSAVIRDSTPGAAWSFRPPMPRHDHLVEMGIVPDDGQCDTFYPGFGYDYEHCRALGRVGLRVAQCDLAEHLGWEASTHGNEAIEDVRTKPLDRARWGV